MDWAERMNQVMDYVEQSLTGEVDVARAARIAACPYPMFQHAFAQAAGGILLGVCQAAQAVHGGVGLAEHGRSGGGRRRKIRL